MIRQPFTERDIARIARHKSIQHYKPRRLKLSIRKRNPGRFLLRLALAVLFALAVWLAVASLAQSATRSPLCIASSSGIRTPRSFALRSTWQMHREHGDKPATQRNGKWECR